MPNYIHSFSVVNLSMFTEIIYKGKNGKGSYGRHHACDGCAELFTLKESCGKIPNEMNANHRNLPENIPQYTEKFLDHQFSCRKGILSKVVPSKVKYLEFGKWGASIEPTLTGDNRNTRPYLSV